MHQKMGDEREQQKSQKRAGVHELAPVAALRAQCHGTALGPQESDQPRAKHQARDDRNIKPRSGCDEFDGCRIYDRLNKGEQPRK